MSFYHVVFITDRVVLTGHSLGGTQARLVAAYLIHEDVISRDKLSVYSFGAPRFADHQFSKYFGQVILRKKLCTQKSSAEYMSIYHLAMSDWYCREVTFGPHFRSAILNAGLNREGGFNAFKYSYRSCPYIIERKATPMFHLFHIFVILFGCNRIILLCL